MKIDFDDAHSAEESSATQAEPAVDVTAISAASSAVSTAIEPPPFNIHVIKPDVVQPYYFLMHTE